MKCPYCEKEIDRLIVVSKCWQYADLSGAGIIDYGKVEDVEETLHKDCPECGEEIFSLIDDKGKEHNIEG